MTRFLGFAILMFTLHSGVADIATWAEASPDKKLFAALRQIPNEDLIYRPDLDGFRIVVYRDGRDNPQEIVARHNFVLRTIMRIAWSPDSKFLLFRTASSGGHSPWHFRTFVFCVDDASFREVEDAINAPVLAPEFRFEAPDIAVLTVRDINKSAEDEAEMARKEIKLPLSNSFHHMKPVE